MDGTWALIDHMPWSGPVTVIRDGFHSHDEAVQWARAHSPGALIASRVPPCWLAPDGVWQRIVAHINSKGY